MKPPRERTDDNLRTVIRTFRNHGELCTVPIRAARAAFEQEAERRHLTIEEEEK